MKKRNSLLAVLLSVAFNLLAQDGPAFTINGYISNLSNKKIYLGNKGIGYGPAFQPKLYDSVFSKDGHFSFKGKVDEINFYSIEIENGKGWLTFLLENTEAKITGNADNIWTASVTGLKEDSIRRILRRATEKLIRDSLNSSADSVQQAGSRGDTATARYFSALNQSYMKELALRKYRFALAHKSSVVSLFELENIAAVLGKDTAIDLYQQLEPSLLSHNKAKDIAYQLLELDKYTQVGSYARDFNLKDRNSIPVSLNSYKGMYVLIDFWASWCAPCRAENPNLLAAYKKYRDNKFDILSVSIDHETEKWLQALQQDSLPWKQLIDAKQEGKQEVAFLYGVQAIPMNFLIDPAGKIIAKNLRGEELASFLSTVFK